MLAGFIYDEGGKPVVFCLVGSRPLGARTSKRSPRTLIDAAEFQKLFSARRLETTRDYRPGHHIQHTFNNRLIWIYGPRSAIWRCRRSAVRPAAPCGGNDCGRSSKETPHQRPQVTLSRERWRSPRQIGPTPGLLAALSSSKFWGRASPKTPRADFAISASMGHIQAVSRFGLVYRRLAKDPLEQTAKRWAATRDGGNQGVAFHSYVGSRSVCRSSCSQNYSRKFVCKALRATSSALGTRPTFLFVTILLGSPVVFGI